MLPHFNSFNNVFVEITKGEHKHGGTGWEFGTCLWSPTSNKIGHDRYSLMRKPQKGDLVLHFYENNWEGTTTDTRLCGYSFVSNPYQEVQEAPPNPGPWAGRNLYYRINLVSYNNFSAPLPIQILISQYGEEIRKDILENRPRFYPFNTYGETITTVQGIYLAQVTETLYGIFSKALGIQEAFSIEKSEVENPREHAIDLHEEYIETKRRAAERYFFSRNPSLVRAAKKLYGSTCQACGFNFEEKYGTIGKGYIEAHHINPLSERSENEWTEELKTTVADIVVLCANCHRMIHRKKPTYSLVELKGMLENGFR